MCASKVRSALSLAPSIGAEYLQHASASQVSGATHAGEKRDPLDVTMPIQWVSKDSRAASDSRDVL